MAQVETDSSDPSRKPPSALGPGDTVGSDDGGALWWSGILGRTRRKPFLVALQVLGSASAVAFSVVLAYLMQFGWPTPARGEWSSIVSDTFHLFSSADFQPYMVFLLVAVVVYPLIFHSLGLYRLSGSNVVPFGQTPAIAKGVLLGTLVLAAAASLYARAAESRADQYSLLFLVYFAVLSLFAVILAHSATLIAVLVLQSFGFGLRRVALVYSDHPPESLVSAMTAPSSAYRLMGAISCSNPQPEVQRGVAPLGSLDSLATIINDVDLDELVLALDPSTLSIEQRLEVAQTCWRLGVGLKMVAPFYPFFHTSTSPEQVGDVSLLQVEKVGLYARWPQVLKRAMDIAASTFVLLVASPVLLAAIIAIKLDSPGAAFFIQTRVGLNGRTFRMLKLRSMLSNADPKLHQEYLQKLIKDSEASTIDSDGKAVYKMVDDPRITRVGKFIRKTSLDELPQLINVLRGEMSLVGPRPPLPYEVAEYEGWHFRRLNIRPGMTGLWQVSGRSQLTYEQMIRLDIDYIENWSLWLDIKILLKTIPAVLKTAQSY